MSKVRFKYIKSGRAKFISHLDLMSTMQRAFLRAGVALKYSEGFNPHPYMSVALPLQVGCESSCELIDVGLMDETLPDIESIVLPEGIQILEAYKPSRKFSEIVWVAIEVTLHYNKNITQNFMEQLNACFARENLMITKRTKRGFKELDIAPYLKNVEFDIDGEVIMTAQISAQDPTLNLMDIESVLEDEIKPEHLELKRIDIYDSNMIRFK